MSNAEKAGSEPAAADASTLGYDAAVGIVCAAAGVDAHNLSRTLNQLGINGVSFQQAVWNGIRKAGFVFSIDAIPNDPSTMLVDVVSAIQDATKA